jgi:hypothetical protein
MIRQKCHFLFCFFDATEYAIKKYKKTHHTIPIRLCFLHGNTDNSYIEIITRDEYESMEITLE